MPTLKQQIHALAENLANNLVAAVQSASLEEILSGGGAPRRGPGRPPKARGGGGQPAPKKTKGGRLARRSPEDIEHVIGLVVAKLGEHKDGLRSEQLQKALKLSKKEIVGPLTLALAKKKVTKKGQRRSTTYFAK
jgi:hypothetical protein